jgi:predicted phosphodiesterase
METDGCGERQIRRLGLIGDVHGEHERLAVALEWLSGQRVDALLCTGDIADGRGCIRQSCSLLRQAGVVAVAGNHDRWLLQDRVRHLADAHRADDLDDDTRAFLVSLQRTRILTTVAGPLLLCHGVGDNDLGKVWPGTSRSQVERSAELDRIIHAGAYRFVINGHLHFRVLVDFERLLLINAGTLKGRHGGVSVVDLESGSVAAFEVEEGRRPLRVMEHALDPGVERRVWRDTVEFDGRWQPVLLYG